MRLLLSIALLALVALDAPGAVAQTGDCAGDCDGDGMIGISELVLAVNIALGRQPLAMCGAADGDGDGSVGIAELVTAVVRALNGCQLSDDEAAEAAGAIALDIVDSVSVFDFGVVGAGGAAVRLSAGALLPPLGGDTGGVAGSPICRPCPGGGCLTTECLVERGVSRLTIDYDSCRIAFGAMVVVSDGRLTTAVDDADYCDEFQVPDGVATTTAFTAFSQHILDANGTPLLQFRATSTRTFDPTRRGCDGQDGIEMFDGTEQLLCIASEVLPGCPPEGRDRTLTARALQAVFATRATPNGCERRRTLRGSLQTADATTGQRFAAVFDDLVVRQMELGNELMSTSIDGPARIDCVGEVDYATEMPLVARADDRCPDAGLLTVQLKDGSSRVQFGPRDAIAVDYDADGSFDFQSNACEDPALARCS